MSKYLIRALGLGLFLGLTACGGSDEPDALDSGAPVSEPQDAAAGTPPVSVQVEAVSRQALQGWIYGQGTARSRQREFLTFTQQGIVSYIDDSLRVGLPVKSGQLIAHQALERVNADLQAAKASVAEAQANLALANAMQKRYETLVEQNSASGQELDEARVQVQQATAGRDNARAQLAQAELSVAESKLISPMDGVLARLNIEKGRYFMPSTVQTDSEQSALRTVPALVIDPHHFEVRVDLPSYNYRELQTGATTIIGANAPSAGQDAGLSPPEENVTGQVHAVSPSLDPGTRTFEVIIHTQEEDPQLQDGEFVGVWIAQKEMQDALVVPLDALRFRQDQTFLYVVDPQTNQAAERRVELGQHAGNYREVLAGVEQGELVVTDGRAALHDGQSVRILRAGEVAQ